MRLIIIFLCAYVPKTAAGHCKWTEVLKDLEQIKASKDIDVSLYTANTDEDKECQEPVIRCFFLETEVILQECRIKNCSKTQDVLNIWKNGNASLENNKIALLRRETPPATECDKDDKDDCRVVETFNLRKTPCRVMRHGVRIMQVALVQVMSDNLCLLVVLLDPENKYRLLISRMLPPVALNI
ncbi:interleukin-15 [Grus japonensis]|uniref:Interleukin n=1 Tax=Grus japonensis TaxID=30415 RepID=A0ABC9WV51_GRUJA